MGIEDSKTSRRPTGICGSTPWLREAFHTPVADRDHADRSRSGRCLCSIELLSISEIDLDKEKLKVGTNTSGGKL